MANISRSLLIAAASLFFTQFYVLALAESSPDEKANQDTLTKEELCLTWKSTSELTEDQVNLCKKSRYINPEEDTAKNSQRLISDVDQQHDKDSSGVKKEVVTPNASQPQVNVSAEGISFSKEARAKMKTMPDVEGTYSRWFKSRIIVNAPSRADWNGDCLKSARHISFKEVKKPYITNLKRGDRVRIVGIIYDSEMAAKARRLSACYAEGIVPLGSN